jgi:poly(A) polymerase
VKTATPNRAAALDVIRTLRSAGHTAYLAGGCVRDELLGLSPKDHDVATSATPGQIRSLFPHTQAVGAAFGVILVHTNHQQIEVATFRTDGSYSDGRRPDSVRFATPQEDAFRRDFTINGLFMDPFAPGGPAVIDFVDGQADLQARVLRAIGKPDERFTEDHLRLLRAVRFASRFNLRLDPATAAAIQRHAQHLRRISPERVGDEVRRMLTTPHPVRSRAFRMLRDLRLLPELFRFLQAPDAHWLDLFPRVGESAPDHAITLPLSLAAAYLDDCADRTPDPDSGVLTLLAPPVVTEATHGLRQALRLSNDECDAFESILTFLFPLLGQTPPTLATKRRFLARPTSADARTLMDALLALGLFKDRLTELRPELVQLSALDNAPPPLLTGDDLTAAGLKPGPRFKTLLDQTYDAQLESRVTTRDEALKYALAL